MLIEQLKLIPKLYARLRNFPGTGTPEPSKPGLYLSNQSQCEPGRYRGGMNGNRKPLSKKILVIAAVLSCIASAAYACPGSGHFVGYSLCRQVSLVGVPGILIAAVVSMALLGGAHGGGPLGMLLAIATPINFLL